MGANSAGASQVSPQSSGSIQQSQTAPTVTQMPSMPQIHKISNNPVSAHQTPTERAEMPNAQNNDSRQSIEDKMKRELSDSRLSLHDTDNTDDGISVKLR